eukprot:gb/GECG01016250.1/.p1 GENE.gb/GECG01016250.1/~~gb/GECG01016250.1/.p1  ORF type:complete len:905 (+),score=126.44 gb/GECG01016250.1/:1-2715(+)
MAAVDQDGSERASAAEESSPPDTLLDRLQHWTDLQPEKILYRFLNDHGVVAEKLTFKEVDEQSKAMALALSESKEVEKGDRVLLTFLPSTKFIVCFLACVRAGLIAVPVYPPDPRNLSKNLYMFASIQKSCDAKLVISHKSYDSAKKAGQLAETAKRLIGKGKTTLEWPDLPWLEYENLVEQGKQYLSKEDEELSGKLPSPQRADVAFLQYTSGSTSEPKGVMITHDNLSHNLNCIVSSLDASTDTRVASWLPQYHDMGLIGSYLGTLYCGGSGIYMSPLTFIKDTSLWIRTVSIFRATHLQAPNFGYALTSRKWEEKGLDRTPREVPKDDIDTLGEVPPAKYPIDLSSVKHIFNAAEPITLSSVDTFLRRFAKYGLKPSAMKPGFGLAEHTVYVCDGGRLRLRIDKDAFQAENVVKPMMKWNWHSDEDVVASSASPDTISLGKWESVADSDGNQPNFTRATVDMIGCGNIYKNENIRVVVAKPLAKETEEGADDESKGNVGEKLQEGKVGEIWIKSNSQAKGYWGMQEKSEETFNGHLLPEDTKGWLRTGDLGFVYEEELFIAGREKDVIILRGRNHFPQDIEYTVQTCNTENVRPGGIAAFSVSVEAVNAAHQVLYRHGVHLNDSEVSSTETAESGETLAVIVEVRNEHESKSKLDRLCGEISRAILSDHGISPGVIFLVKPHGAVKTTSGKIARKWNKRALVDLAELNKGKTENKEKEEKMKWHPKSKVIIFSWVKSSAEASMADGERGDAEEATLLEGPQLAHEIQRQVANLLGESNPSAIPTNVPINSLGLDSMGIMQLNGVLVHKQKLQLSQEQMFAEGMTIWWIVDKAATLRGPNHATLGLPTAEDGRVDDPEVVNIGSEDGNDTTVDPSAIRNGSRTKSKRAEFCERNCPCCICCW